MIHNYFTIAWRNFKNGKLYSFINVSGLAIGIACFLITFIYVVDELSYDRFWTKADRIYRVNEFFEAANGSGEQSSSIPFPMAETMLIDYNGMIEEAVRFYDFQSPVLTVAYEAKEKIFNERNFFFVDSSYRTVFDLTLLKGNSATALTNSNSVVISESIARKYFEDEEPLGKHFRFQDSTDLVVTGLFKDMPSNSHFHADFLASFSTLKSFYDGDYPQSWHWNPCWTYLLLKENADPKALEAKFPDFVQKHLPDFIKNDIRLSLQSLVEIHLTSHLEFEIEPNGSEEDVYLFSCIAIFVLIIACINFVNLSTARSMNRAKEVGMRKAIGSQKHQLIFQFMLESVMITMFTVVLAAGLVIILLPYFNAFAERHLVIHWFNPTLLLSLVAIGLIVGLVSGIYPAIVLTSFHPVKVLKSNQGASGGFIFRKVLVITQFVISLTLIIGTGIIIRQVGFLQTSSVGFKKDHIVMISVIGTPIAPNYRNFVNEVLRSPGIESVTALEEILGAKHQGGNYQFEGMEASNLFSRLKVRHDFLKTFNIPLVAGRDYSIVNPRDDSLSLVVNETLIKGFGWTPEEAIGKPVTYSGYHAQIIGIAKDFNFSSKREPIQPLVLQMNNSKNAFRLTLKYMAVRISPGTIKQSLGDLEQVWKELVPGRPFEYFFLDNELNALYRSETDIIRISTAFSLFAIGVACLGLFGLVSFNAEQRKKEISIRKILGGSIQQIIQLMLMDYAALLIIAVVIGCPISWFVMDKWLNTYAYRIEMPFAIFGLASLITMAVALLTVSYKSFSVARSNLVDSLRAE
jgi:putative ABC transport system permease protein